MAELLSVATALPEHCVSAADTKRSWPTCLPAERGRTHGAHGRRGGQRHPLRRAPARSAAAAWRPSRRATSCTCSTPYGSASVVARDALHAAGLAPTRSAPIIGVSSTGYLMPTLETHLLERLQLTPSCRRVPLTQLGCAGGAAGLALAAELCAAAAAAPVLVVSVELPSLSFPSAEPSPTDVIAALQFGDGAAAAVVASGATATRPGGARRRQRGVSRTPSTATACTLPPTACDCSGRAVWPRSCAATSATRSTASSRRHGLSARRHRVLGRASAQSRAPRRGRGQSRAAGRRRRRRRAPSGGAAAT